jgi:hypothetical protein
MIFIAIGVLVLAALVAVGRKPLMARTPGRLVGLALAGAAAAAAVYDAARGGWIGGSILLTGALWLAQSTFGRRRVVTGGMGPAEAASILGVAQGADREEVEAAYRRLMFRVHPDHGGAAGLAAQLNAARSVLLEARR